MACRYKFIYRLAWGMAGLAAQSAWAAEELRPKCFLASAKSGLVERICESDHLVTVETVSDKNAVPTPSPAALRDHALTQSGTAEGREGPSIAETSPAYAGSWSGARLGVAPWGTLAGRGRGAGVTIAPRLSFDYRPSLVEPWVIGLVIDDMPDIDVGPTRLSPMGVRAQVVSASARLGYVIGERFMIYVRTGLAANTAVFKPLDGGVTAGVGVAYQLDPYWTLSGEYSALFLNEISGAAIPLQAQGLPKSPRDHQFLGAALYYKFL